MQKGDQTLLNKYFRGAIAPVVSPPLQLNNHDKLQSRSITPSTYEMFQFVPGSVLAGLECGPMKKFTCVKHSILGRCEGIKLFSIIQLELTSQAILELNANKGDCERKKERECPLSMHNFISM